jgi:uncharacterized protein (DUF924 family)
VSTTPEEVLSYWFPEGFDEADPQTRRRQAQRWMAGGPEVDREITERFGETLEKARRGELDHWARTARGRLALIVVLDQFSRNVYRGSPLSYAQDEKALRLAVEGIESGMDRELSRSERFFFWLPLGHSGWATRRTSRSKSAVSDTPRRKRPPRRPTAGRWPSLRFLRPRQPATS